MLKLHNLGIGNLKLGESLSTVSSIEAFNQKDGKLFIPVPDSQSWYRYVTDDLVVEGTNGRSFEASIIYFAIDPEKRIKRISIFPDPNSGTLIQEVLTEEYGEPGTSKGGFGNISGMGNYTIYIYLTSDKKVQIPFFYPTSSDFGLAEITMILSTDMDANRNYKLLYRSWVNQEGL